tara:strand:- start:1865 stop:2083 length:219 start_codon:yes stop_codon:yes gene_type:complete
MKTKGYTKKEVAELFNVTPSIVTHWDRLGKIDRVYGTKLITYDKESLIDLANKEKKRLQEELDIINNVLLEL